MAGAGDDWRLGEENNPPSGRSVELLKPEACENMRMARCVRCMRTSPIDMWRRSAPASHHNLAHPPAKHGPMIYRDHRDGPYCCCVEPLGGCRERNDIAIFFSASAPGLTWLTARDVQLVGDATDRPRKGSRAKSCELVSLCFVGRADVPIFDFFSSVFSLPLSGSASVDF